MYIQLTTRCNMTCEHCCYSCTNVGEDMTDDVWRQAISYAQVYTEYISLGGGEPTLHPKLFEILKQSLEAFGYVWFATNGSQSESMYRIADIIDDEDHPGDYCTCDPEDLEDGDYWCEDWNAVHNPDNRLSVDLSTDYYHDSIDPNVRDLWERRANSHSYSHFSLRDITQSLAGVIGEGRGKDISNIEGCVCSDKIIKPNGDIKPCGCSDSPTIGNIWSGIDARWRSFVENSPRYQNTNCFFWEVIKNNSCDFCM